MDGILDIMGKEQTEEERAKLADKIQIIEDDKMPYSEDHPVDILFNSTSAIRRS